MKKRGVVLILAILVMLALVTSCSGGSATVFSIEEATNINASGYDGYGYLSLEINQDALLNSIWDGTIEQQTQIHNFNNSVEYIFLEQNGNFENGDTVDVTATWNENIAENLNLKIGDYIFTVTVGGLSTPRQIMFNGIFDISFKRGEGIEFKNKLFLGDLVTITCLEFPHAKVENNVILCDLYNGQEITLKVNYDEAALAQKGYIIISDTETFTVSGLPEENVDYVIIDGKEYDTGLDSLTLYSLDDIEPLKYMTNLKYLDLGKTEITDISALEDLTELEYLDLRINNIEDISPLAGMTKITFLDLGDNQITDISPLAGLTSLKSLRITGNKYTDISALKNLENLERLITGNIDNALTAELKEALPNCEVQMYGYIYR